MCVCVGGGGGGKGGLGDKVIVDDVIEKNGGRCLARARTMKNTKELYIITITLVKCLSSFNVSFWGL